MDTEIIKLSGVSDVSPMLSHAADVIKNGGLVVFPTETVYGLGADATNKDAALKIYSAKGRPQDNPLIIHIADPSDAEKYAYTNPVYYKLAEKFMPGPLTVILKSKDSVPKETRGGLDTVAVRCPVNDIARELIKLSGVPIAAPSANLSGSPSPTRPRHVIDDMLGRVDVIIDGGECDFGLESTIVRIDSDDSVTLLRPGKITVADIQELNISVSISDAVISQLKEGDVAESPGMKYRHYAPKSPVVLLDGDVMSCVEYIKSQNIENVGIIVFSEDCDYVKNEVPSAFIYEFSSRDDELGQAHMLFDILRCADKKSHDLIFAPLPKLSGIGLALYNRLIRAAAYQIIKL